MEYENVLATCWDGVPKLNLPISGVEKVNPVVVVVMVVSAESKVNPPVGVPVSP